MTHETHPIGTGERLKRLEDALTPSAETKAAYICGFTVPWPIVDADGNDYIIRINVPWTTIKEIMEAIRLHALPDCGRPVPITRAGAVPVVRPES